MDKKKEKVADTSAIIPSFEETLQNQDKVLREAEAATKGLTESEKAVASLLSSEGWKQVEKYINNRLTSLQGYLTSTIEAGSDFNEIGQRAVILQTVKEELEGILSFVRARGEYVARAKE